MKRTMLALAIATLFGTTMAYASTDDENASADINHQHVVNDVRLHADTKINDTTNNTSNTTTTLDAAAKLRLDAAAKLRYDGSRTDRVSNTDIDKNVDVRKEKNAHSVDVDLKKKLSLSSDIAITGDPTVSGEIQTDSAAIAVIDNRQSISGNLGSNDKLNNTSSINNHVGASAAGNIGMNVAAGDNNAQDNAASLSAADASFSFGMADAEVFVNQNGSGNATLNRGVTNAASIDNNAFRNATGNIGVNVTSGNNNEQKNALAASVATTDYAQSSISSNQVSSGNVVSNAGSVKRYDDTVDVNMSGTVRGYSVGVGAGGYAGSSQGSFEGSSSSTLSGTADQIGDVYPDIWSNTPDTDPTQAHPGAGFVGHFDLDTETQGGSDLNQDGGALAFGVDATGTGTVSGSTASREEGRLGFVELSASDLYADLSGSVVTSRWVIKNATNDASLSDNAFRNASGNIGVNVASGSGNLQANSLALAVAQPSTAPPSGGGE
jgi:hypothetical protein